MNQPTRVAECRREDGHTFLLRCPHGMEPEAVTEVSELAEDPYSVWGEFEAAFLSFQIGYKSGAECATAAGKMADEESGD